MGVFRASLVRDWRANMRQPSQIVNPLAFFVLVVSLFPLGIGPEPAVLARIAPGVVWVLALLAALLSVEGLYRQDYDDGSLEQLVLGARPLYLAVLGKATAQWLVTGAPLTLLAPVAGLMLYLPFEQVGWLMLSLALGTPTITLLAGIGAALTVGVNRGGTLLALIILPLFVPVLVFGTAVTESLLLGSSRDFPLLILCALLAGSITLTPFAIAAALKIGTEQ